MGESLNEDIAFLKIQKAFKYVFKMDEVAFPKYVHFNKEKQSIL